MWNRLAEQGFISVEQHCQIVLFQVWQNKFDQLGCGDESSGGTRRSKHLSSGIKQ